MENGALLICNQAQQVWRCSRNPGGYLHHTSAAGNLAYLHEPGCGGTGNIEGANILTTKDVSLDCSSTNSSRKSSRKKPATLASANATVA